jgi:alkylation response protein AidB-like acyl-CoA dehydrogenase
VVIERYGDAVRFHPILLGLCAHFRVQPRLCAVAMPEHKGRVERAIRYLRERFFAGRRIHSIGQGNQELLTFLADIAQCRPHPRKEGRAHDPKWIASTSASGTWRAAGVGGRAYQRAGAGTLCGVVRCRRRR